MDRLPFDPRRVVGPPSDVPPARRERRQYAHVGEAAQLTVRELSHLIKTTLEQRIASPIRVIGEVSNLSARNHWYFSLKDEDAVIGCVAWASTVRRFGFTPNDGDEVVATGHVSHYGPQGRTQFYVSKLEPVGAGALELRFRAMCDELRGLGYFEAGRKKTLPVLPRRIAVITSASSAAAADVRDTAARRCGAVQLLVVDVRVQGPDAAEQVARAIRAVDRRRDELGVDALLVTRGGGSMEDLWTFNERVVADAVFECELPVVAAIGHESDTTVIELVADVRAATPTQATVRLVPAAAELMRQVAHEGHRLRSVLERQLARERQRVEALTRRPVMRDPAALVSVHRQRLDHHARALRDGLRVRVMTERMRLARCEAGLAAGRPEVRARLRRERIRELGQRLHRAVTVNLRRDDTLQRLARHLDGVVTRHVREAHRRLDAIGRELTALDPNQVLRRGFSYTTDADGRPVRSTSDAPAGVTIVTHVQDGTIRSTVSDAASRDAGSAPRRRRRGSAREDDASQLDLFDGER